MQQTVSVSSLMKETGVTFGTSGARGLVKNMTDRVCYVYTKAFIQYLKNDEGLQEGSKVGIAGDLRSSTERVMNVVATAVLDCGLEPINCGKIPSPAVAHFGIQNKIPTIMVTGSHIPDDRNGIKFNKASGEILKEDEAGIRMQQVQINPDLFLPNSNFKDARTYLPELSNLAAMLYLKRYLEFFPENCLSGLKLGLYEHSGVARDLLYELLAALGANVTRLARSDAFIPVDTEAVRQEDVELAEKWNKESGFDAIVSTDGDADRPLISDENGAWLRGDIVGVLCAHYLDIEQLVTPVSSNTVVEKCHWFSMVHRTKIGSPFVIKEMEKALQNKLNRVAGYEANGGFLLGTDIERDGKVLRALPTRDAVLVIITILHSSVLQGKPISGLLNDLPARYTASDRLKGFATEKSQAILAGFTQGDWKQNRIAIEKAFPSYFGKVAEIDTTDGLRIFFTNDEIVHLRPSGNAPEFRCYTEAGNPERVREINQNCIKLITEWAQA